MVIKKTKQFLEIKGRYIFLILFSVWFIDYITTVIALNFSNGRLVEANPFMAELFSLGFYGWIISLLITAALLFLLTIAIIFAGRSVQRLEEEKNVIGFYNFYVAFVTGVFCGLEILVIINNISLILKIGSGCLI